MNDSLRNDARLARDQIRSGELRGQALFERLRAVPYADRDPWTDAVLGLPELPPDSPLPRGSVPYLPAPVEDILAMVAEAPLRADDVLVDIGAGLGRVLLLAHLLSGARGHGVEIQPALVAGARRCAEELRLSGVSFAEANAKDASLEGSVFFMYSPFNGDTLDSVVNKLREVATRRPIVVCAVGLELPAAPWLVRRETTSPALVLYDSSGLGTAGR